MKVIKNNAISAISTTSADSGHPVVNLLNDSPKKKWAAADSTVTLAIVSIDISGVTDSIGIVGVVAESISIKISDPNSIVWGNVIWGNVIWVDTPDAVDVSYIITDEESGAFNVWVDFSQFDSAVQIDIEFRKTTGTPLILGAGVIKVGVADEFISPKYGLSEGLRDFSLSRELSNGASYYKPRDRVRTFAGIFGVDRDPDFYRFMNIARIFGSLPLMWLIADTFGNKGVVYGKLVVMPTGTHQEAQSELSFQIEEVL